MNGNRWSVSCWNRRWGFCAEGEPALDILLLLGGGKPPIRRRKPAGNRVRLGIWTLAIALLLPTQWCLAETPGSVDLVHRPLPRLQPGIVIGEQQRYGYSNVATIVLPRLASGKVDSLPEFARRYASMFNLTILANVVEQTSEAQTVYLLDKIGVGFAMNLNDKMTIVTSDTANALGANLGMIDRGVLSGNEDCLDDMVQIARSDQFVVFDAQAYMLVGDKHESRILRHLIWTAPSSGMLGFLVWQLKDNGRGSYAIDSAEMQLLPPGFQEDRKIHVSAGNFLSSRIPTPDRFALESVPRGTPVPFAERIRPVAGNKQMTAHDLQVLLDGVGESLALLEVPSVAKKP